MNNDTEASELFLKRRTSAIQPKSCLIVCFIASLILLFAFKDALPEWMTEVRGSGRGRHIPLLIYGSIIGLLVGEAIARILIKGMKLEE